jgi:hypothetical protein
MTIFATISYRCRIIQGFVYHEYEHVTDVYAALYSLKNVFGRSGGFPIISSIMAT